MIKQVIVSVAKFEKRADLKCKKPVSFDEHQFEIGAYSTLESDMIGLIEAVVSGVMPDVIVYCKSLEMAAREIEATSQE